MRKKSINQSINQREKVKWKKRRKINQSINQSMRKSRMEKKKEKKKFTVSVQHHVRRIGVVGLLELLHHSCPWTEWNTWLIPIEMNKNGEIFEKKRLTFDQFGDHGVDLVVVLGEFAEIHVGRHVAIPRGAGGHGHPLFDAVAVHVDADDGGRRSESKLEEKYTLLTEKVPGEKKKCGKGGGKGSYMQLPDETADFCDNLHGHLGRHTFETLGFRDGLGQHDLRDACYQITKKHTSDAKNDLKFMELWQFLSPNNQSINQLFACISNWTANTS